MDYPMAAMNILYRSVKNPYIYMYIYIYLIFLQRLVLLVHSDVFVSYFYVMMTALLSNTVPDADTVKLCSM